MEIETQVLVYGKEDITQKGKFKKRNSAINMSKTDFFKYLKENNLNITSCYIDITGEITNKKRFRCSYKGLIVGTSGIVKEFNELNAIK